MFKVYLLKQTKFIAIKQ